MCESGFVVRRTTERPETFQWKVLVRCENKGRASPTAKRKKALKLNAKEPFSVVRRGIEPLLPG